MSDLGVISGGAVLLSDTGTIAAVGTERDLRRADPSASIVEIQGVLYPGFIDCHTHAVFGGARLDDQASRARGVSYQEIAAGGGGILWSVRDARGKSVPELTDVAARRLAHLRAQGTTTVEVKSGYGLSLESELALLDTIGQLPGRGFETIGTFLGAHEVPPEYRQAPDNYVDLVVDTMLPQVVAQGVARFCDVFCEPGVFTVPQARRVLQAAKQLGLGLKLHADEFEWSGGAELAVELGATSVDHLAAISEAGIRALGAGAGSTVAVLLPGTMLFLGKTQRAPARRLIETGAPVALATDFNPGSSPGMSLPLVAMLGVTQLGFRPEEAVTAITVNAAAALGLAGDRGQVAPGFRADLVLASVRDWRELVYWYGANLVAEVWASGVACHPRGGPVNFVV